MFTETVSRDGWAITMSGSAEEALVRRVRGEFKEMPGMRLTIDQAMRLWSLDRSTCDDILGSLVEAHFLERSDDGRYRRTHGGY